MGFDGEPVIRSLNPTTTAHATGFPGHFHLVFVGVEVLDDGVTEADVEGLIVEAAEVGSISSEGDDRLELLGFRLVIENNNAEIIALGPTGFIPEGGGAADIEDGQGAGEGGDKAGEPLKASGAHGSGEGLSAGEG